MGWRHNYALRSYLSSSLWLVPFLALVAEQIVLRIAIAIDDRLTFTPPWLFSDAGTTAALQTVISLTLSFLVFAFGSILVAIQIASGQLTPRIIATTLLRDNVIRGAVGLFVFTLLFAVGALSRVGSEPPRLVVWIAVLTGFASIAAFLFMIDHCARLLRPVSIIWRVGEQGKAVIDALYPNLLTEDSTLGLPPKLGPPTCVIDHEGPSAIVIAVATERLVREARRLGGTIEVVPRVGDFVPPGEALFNVYGVAGSVSPRRLRDLVAFGPERTIEQDPTFAFRIIVDVAIKALSPAINDPTTGVLAIDQLQRLLKRVGERRLRDEYVRDPSGTVRLVFRTPNWEDFVELALREIRLYGASNFQIARRLRAMLQSLLSTLPGRRKGALQIELDLLDETVESAFNLAGDRLLARRSDTQGLGGAATEWPG